MRRNAIIAGSVIAVFATGGVIAASGGAQGPAAEGTVIKLVSQISTFKLVDVPPRVGKHGKIGAGDEHEEHVAGLHRLARLSQADDLKGSVVGGTGAYVGARGTFASVAGSGSKGGNRRDETITLLP